jgi:pimeloyl-ACP methyl ester carboxylesterase
VHQPEVARLLALLLALVLVIPVAAAGARMVAAAAFLVEFLSAGGRPWLSALTAPAERTPFALPGATADRYVGPGGGAPLVLVHGLTEAGKDDERVAQAADLLARAGFDVVVPTLPGLTRGRLRPSDVEPVISALATREAPAVAIGVSVGAGAALLAAADPRVQDRVRLVVSLGGYARADELLRFYLTGDYGYGAAAGHRTHDRALVDLFVRANADLLDESARRVLESTDPERTTQLFRELSPPLRALLDALSPELVAARIHARLVLVHGRQDPAVPYTETLRLAAARPANTRVTLVGTVEHVEGARQSSSVIDALRLWGVAYELVSTATIR